MIKRLLLTAILLAGTAVFAQSARIDITSPGKNVGMVFHDASEGVAVAQAGWLGDADKDKRLQAYVKKLPPDWKDYSFTFMPKNSGAVEVVLMSGDKTSFSALSSLSAEGATLLNGDFSKLDAKGNPEGWSLSGKARISDNAALVNHDNRVVQSRVQVQQGKPVTIRFKAKALPAEPAK